MVCHCISSEAMIVSSRFGRMIFGVDSSLFFSKSGHIQVYQTFEDAYQKFAQQVLIVFYVDDIMLRSFERENHWTLWEA